MNKTMIPEVNIICAGSSIWISRWRSRTARSSSMEAVVAMSSNRCIPLREVPISIMHSRGAHSTVVGFSRIDCIQVLCNLIMKEEHAAAQKQCNILYFSGDLLKTTMWRRCGRRFSFSGPGRGGSASSSGARPRRIFR